MTAQTLFAGVLAAGTYEWPFEFTFPKKAEPCSSPPPGLSSLPPSPPVGDLPPSMSVKNFSTSSAYASHIEYRIDAQFNKFVSLNFVFLNYIPPRKEEDPDLDYAVRSTDLIINGLPINPEIRNDDSELSEQEEVEYLFEKQARCPRWPFA